MKKIYPLVFTIVNKGSLRENCPNTELLLIRIFLYSDWIRRFTVLRLNTEKRGPEITPYLDTFHAVVTMWTLSLFRRNNQKYLQASKAATLLKSDSNTGIFLWILQNFWEHLFWKASADECSCLLHLRRINGVVPWYVWPLHRLFDFYYVCCFFHFLSFFPYYLWSLQLVEI